jgi:CRP-like cAMP-binding protein
MPPTPFGSWPEEELDHAGRQIIFTRRGIGRYSGHFCSGRVAKPDVSILSNQFLAEVRGYSRVRLIRLAKDMREANVRGEKLGLSEDELGD